MAEPATRLPGYRSQLKPIREQLGLSQQALAERVGVSRQALIAIEAGRQVPATTLALQLARTLNCKVEDLFVLEEASTLEVQVAPSEERLGHHPTGPKTRAALARVDGRWVAHRLPAESTLAADALLSAVGQRGGSAQAQLLVGKSELDNHALIAGCAPLLGPLTGRVGACRDARVSWLSANNQQALTWLAAGLVHVAGVHTLESRRLAELLAQRRFAGRRFSVVNLTRWQSGIAVAPGNPKHITQVADLLGPRIRTARREVGSGANKLLQRRLRREAGTATRSIRGPLVTSHAQVAQMIACGLADAGITIEACALAAGLEFVPLAEERFDLVVPKPRLESRAVTRLFDVLCGAPFRNEAACLPGYDQSLSGQTQQFEGA